MLQIPGAGHRLGFWTQVKHRPLSKQPFGKVGEEGQTVGSSIQFLQVRVWELQMLGKGHLMVGSLAQLMSHCNVVELHLVNSGQREGVLTQFVHRH